MSGDNGAMLASIEQHSKSGGGEHHNQPVNHSNNFTQPETTKLLDNPGTDGVAKLASGSLDTMLASSIEGGANQATQFLSQDAFLSQNILGAFDGTLLSQGQISAPVLPDAVTSPQNDLSSFASPDLGAFDAIKNTAGRGGAG